MSQVTWVQNETVDGLMRPSRDLCDAHLIGASMNTTIHNLARLRSKLPACALQKNAPVVLGCRLLLGSPKPSRLSNPSENGPHALTGKSANIWLDGSVSQNAHKKYPLSPSLHLGLVESKSHLGYATILQVHPNFVETPWKFVGDMS